MEAWSVHTLYQKAKAAHGNEVAADLQGYATQLRNSALPVIFSLKHLAKITQVDYRMLYETVARRRESANYRIFAIRKRSGGRRFIHTVSGKLFLVQKFVYTKILKQLKPHTCSYAFHSTGGIRKCAAQHCGARWLFQYDLENFFYTVNEIDVYQIFKKLGYKNLLSFELAHLCTTTHLPKQVRLKVRYRKDYDLCNEIKVPYRIGGAGKYAGVLPQGAPTSPMLSNLVAENLDNRLSKFAIDNGLVYTRYADDITLSAIDISRDISIGRIHCQIISIIRKCGFKENAKKFRIAGPGSKKMVLGLLVDAEQPRISKEMYKRIDRHLYAASKFGLADTAKHQGFDSAYGFYNHLHGLICYVKDVDVVKWEEFNERFSNITPPLEDNLIRGFL